MSNVNMQKYLVPGLIGVVGSYQIYQDYNKNDPRNKNSILARDIVVLSGTAIGAYGGFCAAHKYIPQRWSEFYKNLVENLSIPFTGIFGGIISGEISERIFPAKNHKIEKKVKETIEKTIEEKEKAINIFANSKNLINNIDPSMMGQVYAYMGIGMGAVFEQTFAALTGFQVGRQKGLKNKLLKASDEIIAEVIIPLTGVMTLASYLKTKNISTPLKIAIITPAALISGKIGNIAGEWIKNKVTEDIINNEIWEQISKYQQNWSSISVMNRFNPEKLKAYKESLNNIMNNVSSIAKNLADTEKIKEHLNFS